MVWREAAEVLEAPGEIVGRHEVCQMCVQLTGFQGRIITDPGRPNGTMHKLMDVSRLSWMGSRARIGPEEGIMDTYRWFLDHQEDFRG